MGRLSATAVKAAKQPGRYGDGDGLYLLIGRTGARSWVCRVQKEGKRRDIGLGSVKKVSLSLARERAAKVRSQVEVGLDPIAERRKEAGIPTFREAAAIVFAENKKNWGNAKHRDQWLTTLTTYAFPHFGDMAVSKVDGPHVRDALVAIWLDKPETARRVRQRIVAVMDWAIAKGYRTAPLPIAAMNKSLPKVKAKPVHHSALPYADVPAFVAKLRERELVGRLAFEALVLTAARSGEIRGALWSEVDLEETLDDPGGANEGGARACCAVVGCRRQHLQTGRDLPRGAKRSCLSGCAPRQAPVRHDVDQDLPRLGSPRRAAWLPVQLPRLGCRGNRLRRRGSRNGAGAYHREQGGSGLPARQSAGKAARAHGCLGDPLRDATKGQGSRVSGIPIYRLGRGRRLCGSFRSTFWKISQPLKPMGGVPLMPPPPAVHHQGLSALPP